MKLVARTKASLDPEDLVEVPSPLNDEVVFCLKRVDIRKLIAHRNRNAVVRYITRNGEDEPEYVTEREYPNGSNEFDTVALFLADWNIADAETGVKVPIDEEAIHEYVKPEELDYLFLQCHEINPILSGAEPRKKS